MFKEQLGRRFKEDADYYLYELWSMDDPPDLLEYTDMADRLDQIMGFHLSEEELWEAYDAPLSISSVYLFNLYQQVMSEPDDEPNEEIKSAKKSAKSKEK